MFRALFLAVLGAAVLSAVGRLLLGGWQRGAIAATTVIVLLSIGRDLTMIAVNTVRALHEWQAVILVSLLILVPAAALFLLRDALARPDLAGRAGRGLSLVAALILLLIGLDGVARGTLILEDFRQGGSIAAIDRTDVERTGPDIYVILLDGYPDPVTLSETYGVDIAPFIAELGARGLLVDPASHSNYLLTQLSVTSMLHMSQVTDIPALAGVIAGDLPGQPTARRVLNENPVFDQLRTRGYAVVSYAIPFEHPVLRQSDVLVELGGANEFERQLVASSFLLDAWNIFNPDPFASDLRSQIEEGLRQIPVIAENRRLGPRFVFAHILSPRPPFLFDSFGKPITSGLELRQDDLVGPQGLDHHDFAELLAAQVAYVNDATLAAVDGILAASPELPIIIIMSDHGARPGMDFVPTTPRESRDAFGTLFAALTPGREGVFPPGVTPGQVMASIFNSYFGTEFPLPSTTTYASAGRSPFNLAEVPKPLLQPAE